MLPHRNRLRPISLAVFLAAAAPAGAAEYVPGEVLVRHEGEAIGQVKELKGGQSVPELAAKLRRKPGVVSAVPNYKARASVSWNDPGRSGEPGGWASLQWNFIGDASVNAPEAWDLARAANGGGGRGVVVAVVDTGVAYERRGRFRRAPDLRRRTFVPGYDFVDDDKHPNDEYGHGTHIAGTIAQATNNGKGVTGLAYRARIMPVRVLDEFGEGDSRAIARGVRYAAKHGADIINLSLEFPPGVTKREVPDIIRAIRFAHRKGVLVVAAAGNEADARVAYPARARYAISVGATTEHQCQANYSNSGRGLDISAPGGGDDAPNSDNPRDEQNCNSGLSGRDIFQQTFVNNPRRFSLPRLYQGTSMAAAHVSGTAALVLSTRRLGRDPSPGQVTSHLRATARDLGPEGYDTRYGHGLLDAAAALRSSG